MSTSIVQSEYCYLFTTTQSETWLASRCVGFTSEAPYFRMFGISEFSLFAQNLYYANDKTDIYSYAVFPIVEIDLTKVNVGVTGTGAENDGYSLTLK